MFEIVDIFHVFNYFTSEGKRNARKLADVFIKISTADIYGDVVTGRQYAD